MGCCCCVQCYRRHLSRRRTSPSLHWQGMSISSLFCIHRIISSLIIYIMNDSLSLSLSLFCSISRKRTRSLSIKPYRRSKKVTSTLHSLSLSITCIYTHTHTHTHIHIELDIFWVCLIISFYGVNECRVDVVGVHITATHSVPSTDCQNLHTRELSQ